MYGVYRYIDHVALSGSDTDTYRLELQKKNFVGSAVDWDGSAEKGVFKHIWDSIDPENLWENPLQKAELEIYPLIKNSGDFSILQEIFNADEDEFRLVKKINSTQVWEGKVLPGLLSYPESNFIYPASIVAKDCSHLDGEDFPLEDNRETIITTLARLLPYDLPIHSYTSWTELSITESGDFLNQIFHDTIVLRTVDNSSSLSEESWSKFRAIEEIAEAGRLIIRQADGVWNLFQLSELAKAETARRFVYNSSGVLQSSGAVDLTKDIDQDILSIAESSINDHKEAIKENRVIFKHQSGSSEVDFPKIPGATYPGGAVDTIDDEYFIASQPFTGNGDEKLKFNGRIDQNVSSSSGQDSFISITIGDYFLNENSVWKNEYTGLIEGRADEVDINTVTGEIQFFVDVFGDSFENNKPVRLTSSNILPSGLQEFTTYYIVELTNGPTADQKKFKLSLTPNGSAVIPSDDGTGTLYCHLIQIDIDLFKSAGISTGNIIDILTGLIPDAAEGDLEIYLPAFAVGDFNSVYWFNVSASIENPTQAGEEIERRLTQDGAFSLIEGKETTPEIYFGDGPFAYSRSSYRTSNQIEDITSGAGWFRAGETSPEVNHSVLWLKEELDLRRTARRCLQADLHGTYRTNKVLKYENSLFFFLGGTQTGFENNINAEIFELRLETDG